MKANQNFHQQDMEMFRMVNERTAARRQRREEMQLACVAAVNDPVVVRGQNLKAASGAAARVSVGLVVLGGVVRGLVVPGFGFAVAAVCVAWGLVHFRRNRYGNH